MSVVSTVPGGTVRVRVPQGLGPGDSFVVSQDNGKEFKVIVPRDALPGSEIEFTVPGADIVTASEDVLVVKKTVAGAAVAGALIGTILMGPVGGILLASGAAYATTRKDWGKSHEIATKVGDSTYGGIISAAKKASELQCQMQQCIPHTLHEALGDQSPRGDAPLVPAPVPADHQLQDGGGNPISR